jgi:hypothetical protein
MQTTRDVQLAAPPRDLVLHTAPNWTAVIFFAALAALHLCIAVPAFFKTRWEGYMSLLFGGAFLAVSLVSYCCKFELAILPSQRRIRLRNGLRKLHLQRFIDFSEVHGVRLTMCKPSGKGEARIELLCDNEDIECPPTHVPRQQALCLAVLIGVRLIKVSPDGAPEPEQPMRL